MVTWFRGVIQSATDTASGIRIARAVGRGVRELSEISHMQQRGFTSVPLEGDRVLMLRADDLVVAIASAMDDKPLAQPGETVIYSNADTVVSLKADGSILVKGTKVVIESDTVVDVNGKTVNLGNPAAITALDGVVTRSCVCMFSGSPHPDASSVVFAQKIPTPGPTP
jgi:phage gp45-like